MTTQRPNLFFHQIDAEGGFEPRRNGAPGISVKILSNSLDTDKKTGSRTRLERLAPALKQRKRTPIHIGKKFTCWRVR
jgi:hypothetical protein